MKRNRKLNIESNHLPVTRRCTLRFFNELNDHLPDKWRKQPFVFTFKGRPSIKNTIHALNIPHSEVDLILINGTSVDFNYQLTGGEYVLVYPDVDLPHAVPVVNLRPAPLSNNRFIVDVNSGKLAYKLRLLGFDTLFRNDFEDDEIVYISISEERIILTRDRGILKQNKVLHGYWLRNDDPKKQLTEVISRFKLYDNFQPFTRCSNCNGNIQKILPSHMKGKVSDDTLSYYDEFWECSSCGKIYWEGSHIHHILKWIKQLN